MKQFNLESENLNNQDKLTVVKNYLSMSEGSEDEIRSGAMETYAKFISQVRETLFAEFYKEKFYLTDIDNLIRSAEFIQNQDEIVSITNSFDKKLELTKREAIEIKDRFDTDRSLPLKIKIDFIYRLASTLQHGEETQSFSEKTIDSFLEMFGYEIIDLKIPEKHEEMYQAGYIKDNSHEDLVTQLMHDGYTYYEAQLIAESLEI
jgi:hypothetical protein